MADITLIDAVNQALAYEMTTDKEVILLGEDIGVNGGVFRATEGLQDKFGKARVIDTPLAETLIAGMAIGLAAEGLKPVVEIQFMGFIYSTIDQIINHAGRLRNRTRGRITCPMVLRAPYGGGIHAPEHHSESTESIFAHIPGIRVVIPSTPLRAYGLLLAAIRDPDPVIFLEPKRVYRLMKQKVPDNGEALPLDVCYTLKEGSDITLVSWGAMLHETILAAEKLDEEGVSAEVIDVATIKPLDMETILESVEKTGRCVIVHEAPRTVGVGAEIAAQLAEYGLLNLLAPVQRVTGYDTVMPLFRLENKYMPDVDRILRAVNSTMEYA
ncbi:MAG: alpha-ketoacid dehydrogenase subunit beta [Gammaproteobacteria bacterium]